MVILPAICFSFHKFFDEDSTQEKIYHNSVCPLIPLMLQGQNASVFAYGPTGAGMESFMYRQANKQANICCSLTSMSN